MKRDRASDLPFAIFVGDTFRQTLLQNGGEKIQKRIKNKSKRERIRD
jgi:hypothetical protein